MLFVAGVVFLWTVVLMTDLIFKSCLFHGYFTLLEVTGISIKPLQVRWYSTRFNQLWHRLANRNLRLTSAWFSLGFVVTLLVIPLAFLLLFQTILGLLFPSTDGLDSQALQPVIPGVNLPSREIGYYIISLLASSIFHEVGHAVAAAREGVRVHGFGLFLFAVVPAAFVEFSTENFQNLSPKRQLKIICAGVWHNFVLAVFCAFLLVINPVVLSPLYSSNVGAVIASVDHAGIQKPGGLKAGDILLTINSNCAVVDKTTWKSCLSQLIQAPINGYCVSTRFIAEERLHSLDPEKCCGEDSNKNLCFESESPDKLCLPVRLLIQGFSETCNRTTDCDGLICIKPFVTNSYTRLLQVRRENADEFLFWGFPGELYQSVTVVGYKPKFPWLPLVSLHCYETLLRYIISFSLALGVLNAVPCFFLDGDWITKAVVEMLFVRHLSSNRRQALSKAITTFGTVCVASSVSLGIYSVIKFK